MTKAELIRALAHYRDDARIYVVIPPKNENYEQNLVAINKINPERGDAQIVLHSKYYDGA